MILVDSNVIIDMTGGDTRWSDWSMNQIEGLSVSQQLVVNEVVIAEVAPSIGSLEGFRNEMAVVAIDYEPLTDEAAFCAGEAFVQYRRQRQAGNAEARSIIADFLIGGHAQVLGATILTRDPRFYRSYFPAVPLITPEGSND